MKHGPAIVLGAALLALYLRSRADGKSDEPSTDAPAGPMLPPEGTEEDFTDASGRTFRREVRDGRWVATVSVAPAPRDEFGRTVPQPLSYDRTPSVQPWPHPSGLESEVRRIYEGKGARWSWGPNASRHGMSPGAPVLPLFTGRDGLLHWPELVHRDELGSGRYSPQTTDIVPMGTVVPDASVADWYFVARLPAFPWPELGVGWEYGDSRPPVSQVGSRLTPALSGALWTVRQGTKLPSRRAWRPNPSAGWTRNGWFGFVHPSEIVRGPAR